MKSNNMKHPDELLLVAKGINKYFYVPERFQVLNNVNFEVKQGEFVSLTGRSGCGKSTLLYLLSAMDTDYEGELIVNGEEIKNKSNAELSKFRNKHFGFVFRFHYLLPEFTVLENVMLPAVKLGEKTGKEIEHDAMEKLTLLGMQARAMECAGKLSVGYQQRVAIARALINNPDIIICDEPTGNLDFVNTKLVFETLKDLTSNYAQTIIIGTHDRQLAENAGRAIEMCDGKIIGLGIKENIYV
jgi:lipoprotein-releasing system ATP-binding protein